MTPEVSQARVLVASAWRDGDQVRVRLVAADEPNANPVVLDADGARSWFSQWLDLSH
jgi:hypothetical protein